MALRVPRFTIEMLDHFPDDGNRYELLDGVLLVTPAPSQTHQVVATRLATQLSQVLAPSRLAQVVAVGAIQRGERTQLQPDVLVYPAKFPLKTHWRDVHGWWLAAEVLSPSSRIYDREVKRNAYFTLGIEAYWLVDPDDCAVEVWRRGEREGQRFTKALAWHPSALDHDVVMDLDKLFRDIAEGGNG